MANEAAIVSIRQPLFLYGAVKLGHTKHSIFHNCSILFLLSCYEAVFVSFYGGKEIPVEKNIQQSLVESCLQVLRQIYGEENA